MKQLLLFILCPILVFGQTQIGSDIDGEVAEDYSGNSVSLSSDGTVVAIGAFGSGSLSGRVRIYENGSGTWVQVGQDIDSEALNDYSGYSVSLSSNGDKVAIGAIRNNGNGYRSGHVRIYENQSGIWVQIGSDIDGEAVSDEFGTSVSLSSDGNIVAIGAVGNDGNGNRSGHVRIYENQSGIWVQIGSDIDGETVGDNLGASVSISSDGTVVAIGAQYGNDDNSGYVGIYENQSGTWVQIGENIDGEAELDESGFSVSLSSDGTVVAIGAPFSSENAYNSGHIRIYENQSGTWVQVGADIGGEGDSDYSGYSVSLSSDGTVIAIGAPYNNENGTESGHVRIYKNQSGTWVQVGSDIGGEESNDYSGISVSLSSGGSFVAIGASGNDENGTDSGHVRVFDLSAILSVEEQNLIDFYLYPNPTKAKFTIQLENSTELKNVTIYNNLGQQVLTSNKLNINTSTLASGLYQVEIETNKGKSSKKLIIE